MKIIAQQRMQLVVFVFAYERFSNGRAMDGERSTDIGEQTHRLRRVDLCDIEHFVARKDSRLACFATGMNDALELRRQYAYGVLAAHVGFACKICFEPDAIVIRGLVEADVAFLRHGVDYGKETALGRLERATDFCHGKAIV